jgi:LCP family protein required for cell wall assembly
MGFDKQDSFIPRRNTNIDGFVSGSADPGAKPKVHTPQLGHNPLLPTSSAKPQQHFGTLADMPRRSQQPQVLQSANMATQPTQAGGSIGAFPLGDERGRRRRSAGDLQQPGAPVARKKEKKPRSWKRIFKRAGIVLGILVLLGGLWFGFKFYKDIAKITGDNNPLALLSVFHPVPLQNQNGRVNILVAGNSADDVGHDGADLTDSIMVLSVDTNNNTAFILSVPRDLWVDVPGAGYEKINAAVTDGGMPKLQEVIEQTLGITIDYRALVNYGAFRDLVNAVGGITINLQTGDPRGLYDSYTHIKLPNGEDTLNGNQALDLARARCDAGAGDICYGLPDSDFDRTLHQRQMAIAIKDKASQASVIANPFKVSELFDAVGNNVTTNLQLDEIETLYTYMKKINDNSIGSYNINTLKGGNTTLLTDYIAPDGEDALVPNAGPTDYSVIQAQINRIMSSSPIAREAAVVEVLNGTDVTGLAGQNEGTLKSQGITVSVADAPANQATTTIIDDSQGQMPNTLAYLKSHFNATVVADPHLIYDYPSADFIVVLGQSAAPTTSSTAASTTH